MNELNTANLVEVSNRTTLAAISKISSMQSEDHAIIVNDFLSILWEAGLIEINEDMTDLEKIERGIYAAHLFLTGAAAVATSEEQRTKNISNLNACLDIS